MSRTKIHRQSETKSDATLMNKMNVDEFGVKKDSSVFIPFIIVPMRLRFSVALNVGVV